MGRECHKIPKSSCKDDIEIKTIWAGMLRRNAKNRLAFYFIIPQYLAFPYVKQRRIQIQDILVYTYF